MTDANSIKKEMFELKSKKDKYNFTIYNDGDNITFNLENTKKFPIKFYELKTSLKELKEKDDCFYGFQDAKRFIDNGIKKSIDKNEITLDYSEKNNYIILEMRHDIFDKDYVAKINKGTS